MLSDVRIDSRSCSDGSSIKGDKPLKLITEAVAWFECEHRITHISHRLTFTDRRSDRDRGLFSGDRKNFQKKTTGVVVILINF